MPTDDDFRAISELDRKALRWLRQQGGGDLGRIAELRGLGHHLLRHLLGSSPGADSVRQAKRIIAGGECASTAVIGQSALTGGQGLDTRTLFGRRQASNVGKQGGIWHDARCTGSQRSLPMSAAGRTYAVVAYNYAFDSDNKIHSDDIASKYGFKGGLVPGVGDIAYLARVVYDVWGEQWLAGGTLEAKLIKPIYHAEPTLARASPAEASNELTLELTNPQGVVCAAGRAGLHDAAPAPDAANYPRVECPNVDDRPDPTIASFPSGSVLGAYEYPYEAAALSSSAQEMFVDSWPSTSGWHPALALHDANRILRANVKLGPWIHTASRMQLYSSPLDGEQISLRGHVSDTFEKRGHVMTRADLACFANERAIAHIEHTAISV